MCEKRQRKAYFMEKIRVSVIIPVYNVEKYLKRCLKSVVNQTYPKDNYEIICINDCSPDHCQKILDEYMRRYPELIKVYTNSVNLGLGKTREKGIENAKGEFLLFVDSDDYIKKDYIETYYHAMESADVDVVIGGYVRDAGGKFRRHFVSDSVWSVVTYPIACAKMFRKAFIVQNDIKFSEIRCGEDIYFSLALFYHRVRFKVIKYCGYYYYLNRASITGSMNYKKNHEQFVSDIFAEFMNNYDINKLSKKEYSVIEYTYITNMINALITYGHGGGIKRMKKKYEYWLEDMHRKFPGYKKNPYTGILKPRGQTWKIRLGVGVTMWMKKIRLARLMLYVVSLV